MANITLSIEENTHQKMKKFSDIRWSEFVRRCIQKRIEQLENIELDLESYDNSKVLADDKTLAQDWLSEEDMQAWQDL